MPTHRAILAVPSFRQGRSAILDAAAGGGVGRVVGRQFGDPWVGVALGAGIAEIVHRRALAHLLRAPVQRAEDPVPDEAGDPEVALLAVEVVREMMLLEFAQPLPLGHEWQGLDAMAALVKRE